MSQPSEDRSPETLVPELAQVPLSERPHSELQRAMQLRAQESMERQRARASIKPNPWRRIALFALALVPVGLLFIGIDGLFRVFHHMNALYNSPEATSAAASAAEPQVDVTQADAAPGVVLLQPPKDRGNTTPSQTP